MNRHFQFRETKQKQSLTDLSDDSILLLSTGCGGDCDAGAHGGDVFVIRGSSKKKKKKNGRKSRSILEHDHLS